MTTLPLAIAFPLTLLGAIALVLAFDTISALIVARKPSFAYRNLWPLQFALYVVIGFCAAVTVIDPKLVAAIGAITGFVEGTVGWAITWRIGPGRIAGATRGSIARAIFSIVAFGFGLAVVGEWLMVLVARVLLSAHG